MKIIAFFNGRVKRLNIFDIKLVQLCAMCVILILARLIPQILEINVGWLVILLVLCAIRPMYVFFFKRQTT